MASWVAVWPRLDSCSPMYVCWASWAQGQESKGAATGPGMAWWGPLHLSWWICGCYSHWALGCGAWGRQLRAGHQFTAHQLWGLGLGTSGLTCWRLTPDLWRLRPTWCCTRWDHVFKAMVPCPTGFLPQSERVLSCPGSCLSLTSGSCLRTLAHVAPSAWDVSPQIVRATLHFHSSQLECHSQRMSLYPFLK